MFAKTDKSLPISMDPDSPLNRAHQCERKAERMLSSGRYDAALLCYKDAAGHIIDAMRHTTDIHALLSLELQKQHYDKMPALVEIRKQHSHLKGAWASLRLNGRDLPESPLVQDAELNTGQNYDNGLNNDKATRAENEDGNCLKSICMDTEVYTDQKQTSRGIGDNKFESFESLNLIGSEDTDSLLQCLNEHSRENREERRTFYSTANLLKAVRARYNRGVIAEHGKEDYSRGAKPLEGKLKGRDVSGEVESSGLNSSDHPMEGRGHKMEKSDLVRLEELEVKNAELTKHVLNLLQQLESCELENAYLKSSLEDMTQRLESQRSASETVVQGNRTGFQNAFSVPFSLAGSVAPDSNANNFCLAGLDACASEDHTHLQSGIGIPETPPALPPLEMPTFEE